MSANRIMELVTVQTHPFKNLTEALKDILKDVNIEFSEDGMKLVTLDPATQTILVHLKLEAEKFVEYKCEEKIVIGINLTNFYKLIKTITNNDTLTLFIDKNNKHQLGIRIENGDKNTLTTYSLNLMEIDENTLEIDPPEFQSIVVLPSNEFNTVCKNMSLLSETIEIKSIGSQLIFSCKGEFAEQETIMGETDKGMKYEHTSQSDNIIQGYYNAKHMMLFAKCTSINNNLKMYLKNSYPLVIAFKVGDLGTLKLALAPKVLLD